MLFSSDMRQALTVGRMFETHSQAISKEIIMKYKHKDECNMFQNIECSYNQVYTSEALDHKLYNNLVFISLQAIL